MFFNQFCPAKQTWRMLWCPISGWWKKPLPPRRGCHGCVRSDLSEDEDKASGRKGWKDRRNSKLIQGLFESDTVEREETVFDPHNGPVDCDHLLLVPVKATDVQSHKSWAYLTGWTAGTATRANFNPNPNPRTWIDLINCRRRYIERGKGLFFCQEHCMELTF